MVMSQGCSDTVYLSLSVAGLCSSLQYHNTLFREVSFPEKLKALQSNYPLERTWLIQFLK